MPPAWDQRVRDIGEPAKRRRRLRRRRVLRVVVPILFVVALLIAQLAITLQNYTANRAEALKLSDEVVNAVSDRIVGRVDAFLSPASRMTELFARHGGQASSDAWDARSLEPLAREVIGTVDQLAMVNIGTPTGEFVMPKQMPDGSIDTKLIERDGDAPAVTWIRRDPRGRVEKKERPAFEGYDPRQRPWYRGALERDGLYWTEPYLFFTGNVPGVTAGFPIRAPTGELRAVVGVDIELQDLSAFLDSLQIGERGRAAIVNDKGDLIAHPRFPKLAQSMKEKSTLHVAALGDQALLRAFNAFRINGAGATEANLDGERYRLTSRRLPTRLGQNWLVLVAVPENDFVGFVGENNRRTLLLSLSVLGVGALLAGLLAVQGIRADRNAQLVLEQRERVESQSHAISALAQDPGVLDASDAAGLRLLTEMTADAAGVPRCSAWLLEDDRLRCADAYDTAMSEHAEGATLERARIDELLHDFDHEDVLATVEARHEPRLLALHEQYLAERGTDAVLLTPIRVGGRVVGVMMLEDDHVLGDWPTDTRNFAQSVGAILAMRYRTFAPRLEPSRAEPTAPAAPVETVAVASDGEDSSPRFAEARIERCCDATVLVVECVQRYDVTRPSSAEAEALDPFALVNRMACCIEAWRDRFGITAVSVLNERIVVVGEASTSADSARHMASLALKLQAEARAYDRADQLIVRMGLHTDQITRARLGVEQQLQDLSGPAVGLASLLVNLGAGAQVQVSAAVHRLLSPYFRLQRRGRFYTEAFGEIEVFLLTEAQTASRVES